MRIRPGLANAPKQRERANHVSYRAEQHNQHSAGWQRELRSDGFSGGHLDWFEAVYSPTLDDNDADPPRKGHLRQLFAASASAYKWR